MPPPDADPLAHFTSPPPNESPTQRAHRLESEAAARKISDRIDDELRAEKARLKRERVVRVLLLGQSESGKSTTLKNFRLRYARAAWDAERLAWRSVIQLNVVRSLRAVLECVQAEVDGAATGDDPSSALNSLATPLVAGPATASTMTTTPPSATPPPMTTATTTTTTTAPIEESSGIPTPAQDRTPSTSTSATPAPSAPPPTPATPAGPTDPLSERHESLSTSYAALYHRLAGLEEVERALMRRLGEGGEEDYGSGASTGVLGNVGKEGEGTMDPNAGAGMGAVGAGASGMGPSTSGVGAGVGSGGIGMGIGGGEPRPKTEWGVQRLQDALVRSARGTPSPSPPPPASGSRRAGPSGPTSASSASSPSGSGVGAGAVGMVLTGAVGMVPAGTVGGNDGGDEQEEDTEDIPTKWLSEHRGAAKALWADEGVRAVLRRRRVRVEDGAGFFLDDLDRIARQDYTPSDADVVRARLRTLGVQEYRIHFEGPARHGAITSDMGQDWILYDVGGSRTMRHAWVPYFDNIQAIIFLAPVSCFDERLSEDSKVNRLEDSFLLFREICSSKLLAKATMVLFLNKCDLLKRKLRAGVQVRHYLPSFGSRANEVGVVVKYLREKFREVLKDSSPEQRWSYFYATSVVDTEATATTISAVRDSILQNYLKKADFV